MIALAGRLVERAEVADYRRFQVSEGGAEQEQGNQGAFPGHHS